MKKAQVIWTAEAIRDLETIYDFLAVNSSSAAQRVCENILGKTKQIETFPESGPQQTGLKNTTYAYRYLVEGNYKIIYSYRVENGAAYVHTIFDTRLNPEKLKK